MPNFGVSSAPGGDRAYAAADNELLGWSIDPSLCPTFQGLNASIIAMVKIPVRQTITVTNLVIVLGAAGVTLTAGQNWGALYAADAVGALIGLTADQSTAWAASNGEKQMALTVQAGQSLTLQGGPNKYVYGALLANGTTRPTIMRGPGGVLAFGGNVGLTNSVNKLYRHAQTNSGPTVMPANLPVSAQTINDQPYFMGLS